MSDPYDDNDGTDIPWKPPVIAAIIGALLVAAFVIYAIVNGPVDDPEADAFAAQAVPSKDLPPGYVPLLDSVTQRDSVGIKVESMDTDGGLTTVVVSSAVPGTSDPAQFAPPDVALWELGPEGNRVVMEAQFAFGNAPGMTTIVFPTEVIASDMIVVAHPVIGSTGAMQEIEVGPEMIGQEIPFTFELEPGTVITGIVIVGDEWGSVAWTSPDGMYAKLDVAVRFEGTENPSADVPGPIRFVPTHDPSLSRQGSVITPRPLWSRGGGYGLYGNGRSFVEAGELTSIVLELTGTVVTRTDVPVELEPPQTNG